jgi:hypothetical protein
MSNAVVPIQAPLFREDDFKQEGVEYINQWATQVTLASNLANGSVGPSVLPSGIDMQGGRVTGLSAPQHATDAISSGHAETQFSAQSLQPQLDIGGKNTLKGLAYLYQLQSAGLTGTVALAKITGGGANGSLSFTNGLITGFVAPT